MYVHKYVHTYIYTYIHTYIYIHKYICTIDLLGAAVPSGLNWIPPLTVHTLLTYIHTYIHTYILFLFTRTNIFK
jgi:hypothetical protein